MARTRTIGVAPQRLWPVVADPARLPQWWPGVQRVEELTDHAWTTVLAAPKGKSIRADYTLVRSEEPWRRVWRQEVEESPFERILSESVTEVELEATQGGTLVRLTTRFALRGLSRFGGFQVRRATRRQLEEALAGLAALAGGR